jgi:4-aminobutyrate aminotransferase / (S)-3-amino-2-methylpropionate transaminase / 5-aminovalerate transaminase
VNRNAKGMSLTELRENVVPRGAYSNTPYFAERALGALIFDVQGKEFIDFGGGIGVMNVGHSHPKVVEAVKKQAERYMHTCFHVVMYEPYITLAERLSLLAPGDSEKMTMFANSGAEAVENAVKIARYHTKKQAIICLNNAFHGRTLLTLTLTSKVKPYKLGFGPFAPEIYRMPNAYCYRCALGLRYPNCDIACAEQLKHVFVSQVASENTAAVVAEPVQGEGGFIVPPAEYFSKLAKICHEYGVLLVIDEVQTGVGRTGKLFGIEHWNIEPDIITLAKSLAAGMPLSAIIGKKDIMNSPHVGGLGTTFGGNPVSCSAALAVLDIIHEEDLLEKAVVLGKKLKDRFDSWQRKFELVGDVRGLGAMVGIELVKDRESKEPAADEAKAFVKFCYERGLIILSCGELSNVIRTLIPLTIQDEYLERGLAIMEEGLEAISKWSIHHCIKVGKP